MFKAGAYAHEVNLQAFYATFGTLILVFSMLWAPGHPS